ncbi:hypothetical protein BDR06DRAFT_1010322 [Suillus hirtellus]|nr:hypothetical protein BDR06DRAFT_1010322 [Suillus hirtellus]
MANGNIINVEAKWLGTIEINGIQANRDFEVFDSGGGWAFLFRKPLLQSFEANHNYKSDSITISDSSKSTTLYNQIAHPVALQHAEQGTNLTQDIKQQDNQLKDKKSQPLEIAPMGQWKPPTFTTQHEVVGSEKLPSREVEPNQTHCKNTMVDNPNPLVPPAPIQILLDPEPTEDTEELLGELPEPQQDTPDIFTRHTWPNNPARVTKILSEITISNDITADKRMQVEDFI